MIKGSTSYIRSWVQCSVCDIQTAMNTCLLVNCGQNQPPQLHHVKVSQRICIWMSIPVFSVNRNRSRSITPTAIASTPVEAQSPSQACPFIPRYWSITCHKSRPPHAELRGRPRPPLWPGTESGNERESDPHTVKERKVMRERGVRGNWCSWQTEKEQVEEGKKENIKMGEEVRAAVLWMANWWTERKRKGNVIHTSLYISTIFSETLPYTHTR